MRYKKAWGKLREDIKAFRDECLGSMEYTKSEALQIYEKCYAEAYQNILDHIKDYENIIIPYIK